MKICFVYQDQYPWDVRIEKFCRSLTDHGNEINLVCRNRNGLSEMELIGTKLTINRLRYFRNRRINDLCNFPAFFSPFWIAKITKTITRNRSSVILVRDLPLSPTCLAIGKLMKLPVVLDMAENYPAMIADTWKYGKVKIVDYLIRNPKLLKIIEKKVLPRFDRVFVVSDRSKKRLVDMGVHEGNIFVVGNTPSLNLRIKIDNKLSDKYRHISNFLITYVGGLEESRGVETVIRSLPEIKRFLLDVTFLVVGTGSSLEDLKKLAKKLSVEKNVVFCGWKKPEEVPSIIKASDICIIPHYVTEHTDTTIPNKLFDYMLQGKPVLTVNSKSLIEIVEPNKCGRIFKDKDYHDLAEKVRDLIEVRTRRRLGENGYYAVLEKYHWEIDEKQLLIALHEAIR
jgi:glycosyltransferase involved in cell wall biosynthesis